MHGDMGTAVFVAAIGVFGLGIFLFALYQAWTTSRERANWVRVPAKIVESTAVADQVTMRGRLDTSADMFRGAKATVYKPRVRYAYDFEGKEYESDEIGGASLETGSKAVAERLASQYPMGMTVEAWVNPAKPSEAALKPAVSTWFVLLFISLSIVWATGFGLLTWHFAR